MIANVRLAACAVAACAIAAPAMAAPLLLIDGGDRSVVVLDLGSRQKTGDLRRANIYRGTIAEAGRPRQVTGERREFDCPARRERMVATLEPQPGQAPREVPAEGPWRTIAWKSPMDYAEVAVCLLLHDDDRVSTKNDVPSMLEALERVWNPLPITPEGRRAAPPPPKKKRSWLHPF